MHSDVRIQIDETRADAYRAALRCEKDPIVLCIWERIRLALLRSIDLGLTHDQHDFLTLAVERHQKCDLNLQPLPSPCSPSLDADPSTPER